MQKSIPTIEYSAKIVIDATLIDDTGDLTSDQLTHLIYSAFIWANPEQVTAEIMDTGTSKRNTETEN